MASGASIVEAVVALTPFMSDLETAVAGAGATGFPDSLRDAYGTVRREAAHHGFQLPLATLTTSSGVSTDLQALLKSRGPTMAGALRRGAGYAALGTALLTLASILAGKHVAAAWAQVVEGCGGGPGPDPELPPQEGSSQQLFAATQTSGRALRRRRRLRLLLQPDATQEERDRLFASHHLWLTAEQRELELELILALCCGNE